MNQTFSGRRLWLLIRGDAIGDYRPLLMKTATLAGLMLLSSMYTVWQNPDGAEQFYVVWFFLILYIGGSILASASFKELHDKTRNEAYLLLPASALEKTIARLLRTTVGYFAYVLILVTLTSFIVEGVNWAAFGRRNAVFDPLHAEVWRQVGHFLVTVSLYFLGAAWFRKMHFLKTALTLTAIPIVLGSFAVFLASLLFDFGGGPGVSVPERDGYNYYLAHKGLFDALLATCQIAYFAVLPVFCWWVAWLRVKETQVSHGV